MAERQVNPDYDPGSGDYTGYGSSFGGPDFSGNDAYEVEESASAPAPTAPPKATGSPQQSSWGSTHSSSGGGGGSPPAKPSDDWYGLSQDYRNELTDIYHQWQVDTGFLISVGLDQLGAMGKKGVLTESDFGQFMAGQMTADQQKQIPWGMFGMTKDNYIATINAYSQSFFDLTGKTLDVTPGGGGAATGGSSDFSYISQFLNKQMTGGQFSDALQADQKMRDTYGWIKYGYNFSQFQQFKTDQTRYLGTTMSDSQALLQLQYRHVNQGSGMSAVAYSPLPGVPSPKTLTLEGSVAR